VDATELQELAKDSGRADTGGSGDTIVARLDAATRITEGQDTELWVDARSIHVFDPATGQNISLAAAEGDGQAGAGTAGGTGMAGGTAGGTDSGGSTETGRDVGAAGDTPVT
jgi:hypothetical protein